MLPIASLPASALSMPSTSGAAISSQTTYRKTEFRAPPRSPAKKSSTISPRRMRRDDLLVVCTDGSPHDEFFDPIKTYFREVIFLDRYLRENNEIRDMMSQLPSNDDAVEVLLTQLVASKAMVFAGTLFSTFTGLIHRLRGFAGVDSKFLYCYNDFLSPSVRFEQCEFQPVADGPYSWNRIRYPVSPDAYSWFREWPEAFEMGFALGS